MAARESQQNIPRACNVEDIFHDFLGRRVGLLRAFTAVKESLRLYGLPDKQWELVTAATDKWELREIPAPVLGINLHLKRMHVREWVSLVALHCDSWLLAVAFYYAAKSGFDKADREQLHHMINNLPTLYELFGWEEPETQSSTNNKGSPKVGCDSLKDRDKSKREGQDENQVAKDEEEEVQVEEGEEAHSCPHFNKIKRADLEQGHKRRSCRRYNKARPDRFLIRDLTHRWLQMFFNYICCVSVIQVVSKI
ncbi:hypothetical protein ACET3Z_027584 [Daucus carota]